ncbi:MAG: hypothetical protein A2452_05805 [Candidatus Firestonebacteria bacterium RIFOXYC2_FULL_39_67]|nr:MAG: hypothetical protein A2536_11880 [Candidatus Firestonebacteria bacterium RIFOXYD2_FULL_39_29]OGF56588.1 MAG: hypothetical protein A2452_05805 [Candidatus Firestonebacteria bacterium RIFOXYC2_FULL_39_67]OGF57868.1 MAG: hypothetical protein A2497_08480 [Candidatus Firestonebacteria bacterium RifOxyC12_full_39_7]
MGIKIVFIGASYLFNHRVFKDFVKVPELKGAELVIYDIKQEPIDIVSKVCEIIKYEMNSDIKVSGTTNRKKALQGADFVLSTFNVGVEKADKQVLEVCRRHKISYGIGDTIGPSALIRSFRNIIATLDLCKDMEEYCPEAWLINFSNPMAQITHAIRKYSKIKAIGLCHALFAGEDLVSKTYGVDKNEVQLFAAGVNHLTWVLEAYVKGQSKTKTLYKDTMAFLYTRKKDRNFSKDDWVKKEQMEEDWKLTMRLFEKYGALLVAGDTHVAEFFPFFYKESTGHGKRYGIEPINIKKRIQKKLWMKNLLVKWVKGVEKPWDMDKFSGEDAHSIIVSIIANKNRIHQVNILNNGSIKNVPSWATVEAPAIFGGYGYKNVALGNMPNHLASIITNLATIHDYTVDAIVKRDRKLAIQALLLDPLLKEFDTVEKLLDDLLASQKKYIPSIK